MRTTKRVKVVGAALLALALALPAAVMALPSPPFEQVPGDRNGFRQFHATDADGNLVSFSALTPEMATERKITGLPTGVALRGIDYRPATGDLYGIGSDSVVYRVNPGTAIAVAEGPAFTPALRGNFNGVDFNPVVDLIRVTSSAGQNLRVSPDPGAVVAADADINPDESVVVGSAYSNSSFSATRPTATTLYALDALSDSLCLQNPPNAGTLTGCRELSISVRTNAGFDVAGSDVQLGYVATRGGTGGASLYRVNLGTGAVAGHGQIGDGGTITGLAAVQDTR